MKDDEYLDMFFKTAKEMGYTIETCKRGKARGQLQINFGNKKLHANHIKKLQKLHVISFIAGNYSIRNCKFWLCN